MLNIFIIIKITKSARFRKQFRRHDDVEDQQDVDQDVVDHENLIANHVNPANNKQGNKPFLNHTIVSQ